MGGGIGSSTTTKSKNQQRLDEILLQVSMLNNEEKEEEAVSSLYSYCPPLQLEDAIIAANNDDKRMVETHQHPIRVDKPIIMKSRISSLKQHQQHPGQSSKTASVNLSRHNSLEHSQP